MSGKPVGRLFHVDALRAFCMLYGIFVHGATIGDNPLFSFVKESSDLFRMATFMLISGFFTTMVAARSSGVFGFYRNRVPLLVYPLVSCLLLLNPWTTWLIHIWHNGPMTFSRWISGGWREPTLGNDVWHLHLWFLFCLIAYAFVTPAFLALFRSQPAMRLVERYCDMTGRWTAWANVLVMALVISASRGFYDQVAKQLVMGTPFVWIVGAIFTYLPYFLLGMVCFLNRRLFQSLHVLSWPGLILFALAFVLTPYLPPETPRAIERTLHWVSRSGLVMFIICALLYLFQRYMNRQSAILAFFVDAAYSFYLFQMAAIYIIATIVGHGPNIYLTYAIILIVGTPLLLAFHRYVIAPVPLLRLMFNGKVTAKRTAADKPARVETGGGSARS